jgi:predicted nuclease with TOPRIM domain
MDDIIREIIKIDQDTLSMKKRYEELIKEKENELKKTLADLEKSYIVENVQHESMNSEDITVELNNLEDIYTENMHNIDKTYKQLKDQLVENIWKDLF